jgi:V/A-type H+-transporting ATPase subunit K
MTDPKKRLRRKILISLVVLLSLLTIGSMIYGAKLFAQATTGETGQQIVQTKSISAEQASISRFAFIAAAVAFGLGAIGAGVAIGNVGAAAMGAIAEKPEIAGQALIFVALAEGLVVFGFITALMILGKV